MNPDVYTFKQYQKLCADIERHNQLYFQEAQPVITDEEFDTCVRLVASIEKIHPEWVGENSPSTQLGEAPLSGFAEVPHSVPMLSLEKAFTKEEIQAFIDRAKKLLEGKSVAFSSEVKMDGLALSVLYVKGKLQQALTRGDGRVGSDVTQNVKMIVGVPHILTGNDVPEVLEVRGEVFLPLDAFKALNLERQNREEPLWANARNAAAGALKLLDPNQVALRKGLSVAFYGISRMSQWSVKFQHEIITYLESVGLPTVHSFLKKQHSSFIDTVCMPGLFSSAAELMNALAGLSSIREKLPFAIDGVVFKLDNLHDADILSSTAKHPRSAIAYKFSAEQAWTRIKAITVQVGRTGVLTPVAELEPTLLAGSTIARATLHNEEEIQRKDIRVGDRVVIEKGGDVIPKVVLVDLSARDPLVMPWRMPESCPCCGTKVVRDEKEVAIRCPNALCPEQVVRALCHFAGKDGLDIEGLGDKIIRQLVAKGFVKSPSDLFFLIPDQIRQLEGFKEKSTVNLIKALENAKKTTLDRLILALGIRHVGVTTAELIAKKAGSLEGLHTLTRDQLLQIHGIGEAVADAVSNYFSDPRQQKLLEDLKIAGITFESAQVISSQLAGQQIVLTGSLETMTRGAAAKRIKELGGMVTESVSKKTDLVVVGADPGSKYEKAQKLGIKILTEAEFIKLIEQ